MAWYVHRFLSGPGSLITYVMDEKTFELEKRRELWRLLHNDGEIEQSRLPNKYYIQKPRKKISALIPTPLGLAVSTELRRLIESFGDDSVRFYSFELYKSKRGAFYANYHLMQLSNPLDAVIVGSGNQNLIHGTNAKSGRPSFRTTRPPGPPPTMDLRASATDGRHIWGDVQQHDVEPGFFVSDALMERIETQNIQFIDKIMYCREI